MGLPAINIVFKEAGVDAIKRGDQGVVALILKDEVEILGQRITSVLDIPEELNEFNKDQIRKAFLGYQTVPRAVVIYSQDKQKVDYADALKYLENVDWDWLAIPEILEADTDTILSWIKDLRDKEDMKRKVVLPKVKADHEGVVNFTSDDIKVGNKTYSTAEYCARIAGLLAGTPLKISATFAPLPEVDSVAQLKKSEIEKAINSGEFVIFNDGKKVKVARAVNSLTTTSKDKLESFKKIKIVEAMDLIHGDIKRTAEDSYIGKYPNTYDNKVLLMTAISAYFEALELDDIVATGSSSVGLDIARQINYLKSKGKDIDSMALKDIKNADTGSHVFILAQTKIMDAIEDIKLDIVI